MPLISLQVIDGVDKGKWFVDLDTPVSIGREEGNSLRLNDDRISRFHAKIQVDHERIVVTDLDSTNGTRVNGEIVQIRLIKPGDRISVGRSTLVFGSPEEIAEVMDGADSVDGAGEIDKKKRLGTTSRPVPGNEEHDNTNQFQRPTPPIPERLSAAQAAQLSEMLDYLHGAFATALDGVVIPQKSREAKIPIEDWHRVQQALASLARYSRQVTEPQR